VESGPAEVVEDAVGELALEGVDGEELEIDGASVAVVVTDMSDEGTDVGADAEFLVELAMEGFFGRFAGFDFAAGELPFEAHGLIGTALTDEDFVTAKDQRSHNIADGPVGIVGAVVLRQSHSS